MTPGAGWIIAAAVISPALASDDADTPEDVAATDANFNAAIFLASSWAGLIALFTAYHVSTSYSCYRRRRACLNDQSQSQSTFRKPNAVSAWLKRHILDSPLLRTRHHRELSIFGTNLGCIPSRLQTILLLAYMAFNGILSFLDVDMSSQRALEYLRDRSGVLCVVNLLILFLVAGRNNPLIYITGISFDTYNLIHRGVGRVAIGHAVAHFVIYLVHEVQTYGWHYVWTSIAHDPFYTWGTVALVCFLVIFVQAWSPLRHAFYEFFLHFHIFLSALGLAGIWIHCATKDLYQIFLIQIALGIWGAERIIRLFRLGLRNFGSTRAEVEVLPDECLRINLDVARPWKFSPGQHLYLYIPSVGWWTSHPFSIGWFREEVAEKDLSPLGLGRAAKRKAVMSLLVRRRNGFTDALYRKAKATPGGPLIVSALVEGPYGLSEKMSSYGSVVLFAGGVGIAHHIPQVRNLVDAYSDRSAAIRRVTLIWITQSDDHLEWIRPWITEIFSSPATTELLKINVFVTRQFKGTVSCPQICVSSGRPNIENLVDYEMDQSVGACAVSVCGTGSLADEVRRCVRARESKWNVDLFEESFSW